MTAPYKMCAVLFAFQMHNLSTVTIYGKVIPGMNDKGVLPSVLPSRSNVAVDACAREAALFKECHTAFYYYSSKVSSGEGYKIMFCINLSILLS